jgi:diaminopimelate decarboxylase
LSELAQQSKALLKRGIRAAVASSARASQLPPEHWGLERGPQGLRLQGLNLNDLAEKYGSPLHVVNAERLRRNALQYLAAPSRNTPAAEVFYSYKTNPVPGVLAELHRAGLGAEVISHYELWLALRLGVPAQRIVYNGPVKSTPSLELAIEQGIQLININHREEIAQVARVARTLGRRPRVGLRVTVGRGWSGQFGTPVAGGQALAAYREALDTGVLEVVALHAHRGGMLRTADEVLEFLEPALAFSDELSARLGLELEVLNLGGSLAVPSVRGLSERELRLNRSFMRELSAPELASSLSIGEYTRLVAECVVAHYRTRGRALPRVFLEPGRSVTSDAQLLLTRVQSIKAEGERRYAILDAGINLAESCRSEYHQWFMATPAHNSREQSYALAGPICTPGDTLRWAIRLPTLRSGDCLAIMDAGAYFVPFSTSFSFPRPAIVMVDGGNVHSLRRAETFEDVVRLDHAQ